MQTIWKREGTNVFRSLLKESRSFDANNLLSLLPVSMGIAHLTLVSGDVNSHESGGREATPGVGGVDKIHAHPFWPRSLWFWCRIRSATTQKAYAVESRLRWPTVFAYGQGNRRNASFRAELRDPNKNGILRFVQDDSW